MEDLFQGLGITDYHGDLHRNIVSIQTSQDLFDDLSDSPADWQAAIELEQATKPPTYLSSQPIIDRPFEEAAYNEAIDYPFKHWTKSRYSDGSYGVWYGADTLETTIYETVNHWRVFLQDAGWDGLDDIINERKVYRIRCDAGLLNFIPQLKVFPALVDPAPGGNHFTHLVGTRIHHEGHPGLVTGSARCDGNVTAIFNPRVLSNPQQYSYLSYRIENSSVIVERTPGKRILVLPLS